MAERRTSTEPLTADSWLCISLRNKRQRGTSQHTVNANELYQSTLGIGLIQNVSYAGVDRKGAEFIGNKHI